MHTCTHWRPSYILVCVISHLAEEASPRDDGCYGNLPSANSHLDVCESRFLTPRAMQHEHAAL